jgi:4-amino-4-deoxy-L-arabinose transferase-like glycosyltransferase
MISHRGGLMIASVLVGLATLGVMLATEPRMAIAWDEGYTLGREARLRAWFQALRNPAAFSAAWKPLPSDQELVQQRGALPPAPDQLDRRAKLLFDPGVLAYFWPFAREEPHGHPPFYALLGLLGDLVAPTWPDLPRARLGPILLFSVTAALACHFLARRWGPWAAIGGVGAWVLQPNLFGHAHYAAYDGVLTSLWVLAILAYSQAATATQTDNRDATGRRLAILGFGVDVGCAMATKFTGWFLPIPFVACALWTRDRRAFRVLLIALPLAVLVLFLLNPPWWTEPFTGVVRLLGANLTRGQTIPIPVQFLGTLYETPRASLPWYNTLVWTLLVTPVGFLLLSLAGMVRAVRQSKVEPVGLLIMGHWLLIMALRALPRTPGHDGVRLFLPAFGVLALLAGMGARQLLDWLGPWAKGVVVAAVAEGAISVLLFMPVPLSYFSPLVGGLPWAARLGMEPTYYWDALDAEARSWLRANTGPGQTIHFATFPTSWLYLRKTGELPRRLDPIDPGHPAWYVLQNRPGAWLPIDRQLVQEASPVYQVNKFGVPLVWVMPYSEVEKRRGRQTKKEAE